MKLVWNDPVWSKVIAQEILRATSVLAAALVAAGLLLYHYRNGGTPLWVSVGLVGIILVLGLSLALVLLSRRTSTKRDKLPIDGLLTSLQIETLQLARDLSDLLKNNPLPKKTAYGFNLKRQIWDVDNPHDRILAFGEARNIAEQKSARSTS
jgi:hypothetical protein